MHSSFRFTYSVLVNPDFAVFLLAVSVVVIGPDKKVLEGRRRYCSEVNIYPPFTEDLSQCSSEALVDGPHFEGGNLWNELIFSYKASRIFILIFWSCTYCFGA